MVGLVIAGVKLIVAFVSDSKPIEFLKKREENGSGA
jgi:hypothetical protein